ncbi:hypothetical protein [Streptomyces sp. NPDC059009]|uniref:hypothetical protein n=1 Tax=Streptomyces sp. NPDC059009 TaxID=3346694 RepID=UPI003698580C
MQMATWALYLSSVVGPLPQRPDRLPALPGPHGPEAQPQEQPPGPEPRTEGPTSTNSSSTEHTPRPADTDAAGTAGTEGTEGTGGLLTTLDTWARAPLPGGWDPLPLLPAAQARALPQPPPVVDFEFPADPPEFLARPEYARRSRNGTVPVHSPHAAADADGSFAPAPWDTVERFWRRLRILHPKHLCAVHWPQGDITRLRVKCDMPRTADSRFLNYAHLRIHFKRDWPDLEAIFPADGEWRNSTSLISPDFLRGKWRMSSGVTVSLLSRDEVDSTHWGTRITSPPLAPATPVMETGLPTLGRQEARIQGVPNHSPAEFSVYEEHFLPFGMTTQYVPLSVNGGNGRGVGWEHLKGTPGLRTVRPEGSTFAPSFVFDKEDGYNFTLWLTAQFPKSPHYDTVEIWVTPARGNPVKVDDIAADGQRARNHEVTFPRPIIGVSAKPRQPADGSWSVPATMTLHGRTDAFPATPARPDPRLEPTDGYTEYLRQQGVVMETRPREDGVSLTKPAAVRAAYSPGSFFRGGGWTITVPEGQAYDAVYVSGSRALHPRHDALIVWAGAPREVTLPENSRVSLTPLLPGRYPVGPVRAFPTAEVPAGKQPLASGDGWTRRISDAHVIDERNGAQAAPERLWFPDYVVSKGESFARWPQICDVFLDSAQPGWLFVGCDRTGAYEEVQVVVTDGGSSRVYETLPADGNTYAILLPGFTEESYETFTLTVTGFRRKGAAQDVGFPLPVKEVKDQQVAGSGSFGGVSGATGRALDASTTTAGRKNLLYAATSWTGTIVQLTSPDPAVGDTLVSLGNSGVVTMNAAEYTLGKFGVWHADKLGKAAPYVSVVVNIGSLVNSIQKDDGLAIALDVIAITGDLVVIGLAFAGVGAAPLALIGLAFGLPAIMLSGSASSNPLADPETFAQLLAGDTIALVKSALAKVEEEAFTKFTQNTQNAQGDFTKEETLDAFYQGWKVAAERITLQILEQREASWLQRIDDLKPYPYQSNHDPSGRGPHGDTLRKNLQKHGLDGWTQSRDEKPLLKEVVRSSFQQIRQNADVLAKGQPFSSDHIRMPNLAAFVR